MFARDLAQGKAKEKELVKFLNQLGITAKMADGIIFDVYTGYRIEVKLDRKMIFTGNIAVEIENTKQKKPSGIMASKADIWVYAIGKDFWAIPTALLKDLIQIHGDNVKYGGDNNSKMVLLPFRETKSCFLNLRTASVEEVMKMFVPS